MAISAKLVNELRKKTGAGIMDCKRALEETDGDIAKAIIRLREKGMASASKRASRVAAEGKIEVRVADDGRVGAMVEINCETDFVARGDYFSGCCGQVVSKVLESSSGQPTAEGLFEDLRKELVIKTGENVVVRRHERFQIQNGTQGRIETYLHMGGKIGVMVEVGCVSEAVSLGDDLGEFCREVAMHVAAANPQYLTSEDVPATVIQSEKDIYRKQALDSDKPEKVVEKMVEGRLKKWYGEFCLMEQPWVREPKKSIKVLCKEVSSKAGENVDIRRFLRYELGEGIEKKSTDLAAEV